MSDNDLMTTTEAMAMLKTSRQTLDRFRRECGLPFVKLGALVRYRRADLEAFVQARTSAGTPPQP